MRRDQPDLFKPATSDLFAGADAEPPVRTEAQLRPIRIELGGMLERARGAARLPWDYTRATVLEMQMESQSRLLPEPEGTALREAFFAELDRLYALEPNPSG